MRYGIIVAGKSAICKLTVYLSLLHVSSGSVYLHCINKGEFRFRPIRAFVYLLALSQSERVHCYYFRFRRVFQHENYGCK
jgi:hypothetical protein